MAKTCEGRFRRSRIRLSRGYFMAPGVYRALKSKLQKKKIQLNLPLMRRQVLRGVVRSPLPHTYDKHSPWYSTYTFAHFHLICPRLSVGLLIRIAKSHLESVLTPHQSAFPAPPFTALNSPSMGQALQQRSVSCAAPFNHVSVLHPLQPLSTAAAATYAH